jgi:hypothetical protein
MAMTTLPDLSFLEDNYRPVVPPPAPTPADLSPEWHLLWDERAAIMEYDGGIPREQAEHLALIDILKASERTRDS